ncbi:MAG: helix-turn-helix transcriptional regulator [Armatimonadota bacterium]
MKSELETLILGALSGGPLHGYGIVQLIRGDTDVLKVGESQLYPALRKMEESGWITGSWHVEDGRPARKVYTLTEGGTKELDKRKASFKTYVRAVGSLLGLPEGGQ